MTDISIWLSNCTMIGYILSVYAHYIIKRPIQLLHVTYIWNFSLWCTIIERMLNNFSPILIVCLVLSLYLPIKSSQYWCEIFHNKHKIW